MEAEQLHFRLAASRLRPSSSELEQRSERALSSLRAHALALSRLHAAAAASHARAVRAEWFRRYVELLSAQLREASGGRVGSLAVAADDPSLLSTLAQVRADPRVALAVVSAHRLINLPLRAEWKQRMARAASEERCETQT